MTLFEAPTEPTQGMAIASGAILTALLERLVADMVLSPSTTAGLTADYAVANLIRPTSSLTSMGKPPKTAILIAMSDEQPMAVGRMVSQWAYYEHLLNEFLTELLHLPESSALRKSIRMTFDKRMQLWTDLAQIFHRTEPNKAADLIHRTKTAHGMRDQIVHGVRWALSDRIDAHSHSNIDTVAKKTRVVISAARVIRLRDEIGELSWEVNLFYRRFLSSRRAAPAQCVPKRCPSGAVRASGAPGQRYCPRSPLPSFFKVTPAPGARGFLVGAHERVSEM